MSSIAILPDDALAEVLRLLPARGFAEARCVCKAWQTVVDEQQLLLRHLLPHSVGGLFVNCIHRYRLHYFARPTATPGPRIDGEFSFIEREEPYIWRRYRVRMRSARFRKEWYRVHDHCNGLVLRRGDYKSSDAMYVCNPATTRQWACLPPCAEDDWRRRAFVVFDPSVSMCCWRHRRRRRQRGGRGMLYHRRP
jgi:hypothetical protein